MIKMKVLTGALILALAAGCFTGCKTNSDETPQVVPVVTIPGGTPAKTGPKNLIIDGTEIAYSSFVAVPAGSVTASEKDANAINGNYGLFRVTTRPVTIPSFNMMAYEVTQRLYKAVMTGDAHADSDPSICKDGSDGYVYADNNEAEKDLRPVDNVTWFDAVYFCNKLSEKTGKEPFYTITELTWTDNHITAATVGISTEEDASKGYRLPFEAEWEYAARGANPSGTGWETSLQEKQVQIQLWKILI